MDRGSSINQAWLGTFLKIPDPAIVEIVALADFDFVIIDMEHGPIGFESLQDMVRAANAKGIKAIVRLGELSQIGIQRALDIGVDGIQIPQINNLEDAKKCIEFAKYHPVGFRGMCRYVRAADYTDKPQEEYFSEANNNLVIVHIEGTEGINNLAEIMTVDGIDVYFLGPYDLSQSAGVPGEVKSDIVRNMMHGAIKLAEKHNKIIGTFTDNIEDIKYWKDLGVKYIAHSVDVGMIYTAYSKIRNEVKG